jgi:hypothetical protein
MSEVPNIRRDRSNSGRGTSWESRFSRYAKNAEVTEKDARFRQREAVTAAGYHRKAAANAREHGDDVGAELYREMADCARDAEAAYRDLADAARTLDEHYTRLAGLRARALGD